MADSTKANAVQVEIFGQSYSVHAGAEPGYVERLASAVDAHMRDLSRSGAAVDSVRVAVLTALNLADESSQAREAAAAAERRALAAEERQRAAEEEARDRDEAARVAERVAKE